LTGSTPQLASPACSLFPICCVQEITPAHINDLSQIGDAKKVIQARNAHVAAAIETGTLDPWSKESIFLYWCVFVAFLCSCANGYVGHAMIR
jgi:hypothetical protein